MRKQPLPRQVIYSKNKSISEVRRCKRANCLGCQKHYENFLQTTSRGTRSNEKSLSSGKHKKVRQFSEPKLVGKQPKNQEVEDMLRAENRELTERLNDKRKKLTRLRANFKKCQEELHEVKLQLEQYRNTHQLKKSQTDKNMFQNVMQSQALARETLQKYRQLEQEYRKYRQAQEKKLMDVRKEGQDELRKERNETGIRINKIRADYETMMDNMKEQHRRLKVDLEQSHEKTRNTQLIRQLRNEIRELQRTNKQLRQDIENRENNFQDKQRHFKENLKSITQRVNHWEEDVGRVRQLEIANQEMVDKYETLLEKYRIKKIKQKQLSQQWADIFRDFLNQISRLKKQLDAVSSVSQGVMIKQAVR